MTPNDFITALAPAAQASQATTNVPASFVIAEAALESGWGVSQLFLKANNIFGVKADSSWHGDTLSLPTHEYENGDLVLVDAEWRKYPDELACINDHAQFLLTNPRYAPAFQTNNVSDFVTAVARAGYATDPQYASKIIQIIRFHNLTQYDTPT
jgi:flagellum-specific peptidoglycan hydrolase FlgJ